MDTDVSNGSGFLGAGVAFPLGVDAQGRLAMNSLEAHVRQSILLIMKTARGERVMRLDFGAGLHDLVFSPATPALVALVEHQVKEGLTRLEPRIDLLKVEVVVDRRKEGELHISVDYRLRRTDTIFNLVYPFYLERGEL